METGIAMVGGFVDAGDALCLRFVAVRLPGTWLGRDQTTPNALRMSTPHRRHFHRGGLCRLRIALTEDPLKS